MKTFSLLMSALFLAWPLSGCSQESAAPSDGGQDLVKVEVTGGMCSDGPCYSETNIRRDGQVGNRMINAERLRRLVDETDFEAMRSRPSTGICPSSYDGREAIYTFFTPRGEEVLRSCTSDLDYGHPLFVELRKFPVD